MLLAGKLGNRLISYLACLGYNLRIGVPILKTGVRFYSPLEMERGSRISAGGKGVYLIPKRSIFTLIALLK
tara:strand:+ start:411 stop:623 length:213 start_codon:yes stop_codon:yes gene_type:complete